ncbi:MAG TPA: hypothetical protein VML75_02800 [Kofleriaceae bacterium]|nr:hypothetical protein [Kofleriaceae bacterium]
MTETATARLHATRALDAFYLPYRRRVNASLFGCCSVPAFTVLAIPTYILLWTEGSVLRSMLMGAGGWLIGSVVVMIAAMVFDGRITKAAARRFEEAFPRETPERALAVEILRARMPNETGQAARSLLQALGELPPEVLQDAAPTVEAELASAVTEAGANGPAVMIPIEDDEPAAASPKPWKPPPPRLRYIPLEPERPPDDETQ